MWGRFCSSPLRSICTASTFSYVGEPVNSRYPFALLNGTQLDSGKSGMAVGMDPRSPANRGWRWGWTPDPRQIGDGTAIPDPRQIGDGGGDGDRGFRATQ